jgi:hypothetical protein
MNDASEIEHGIELSREVFEAIAADGSPIADALRKLTSLPVSERPRINVACFSSARDNLSQWRAYSKNTIGVSLGIFSRASFACAWLPFRMYPGSNSLL